MGKDMLIEVDAKDVEVISGELVVDIGVPDLAIEGLRAQYNGLTADTPADYHLVRQGIAECTKFRTSATAAKKQLKAKALEWGRRVDKEYNRVIGLIKDIETPLRDAQQAADEAIERATREQEEKARLEREEKERKAREERERLEREMREKREAAEAERRAAEEAKREAEMKVLREELAEAKKRAAAEEAEKREAERKLAMTIAAEEETKAKIRAEQKAKEDAKRKAEAAAKQKDIEAKRKEHDESRKAQIKALIDERAGDFSLLNNYIERLYEVERPNLATDFGKGAAALIISAIEHAHTKIAEMAQSPKLPDDDEADQSDER